MKFTREQRAELASVLGLPPESETIDRMARAAAAAVARFSERGVLTERGLKEDGEAISRHAEELRDLLLESPLVDELFVAWTADPANGQPAYMDGWFRFRELVQRLDELRRMTENALAAPREGQFAKRAPLSPARAAIEAALTVAAIETPAEGTLNASKTGAAVRVAQVILDAAGLQADAEGIVRALFSPGTC